MERSGCHCNCLAVKAHGLSAQMPKNCHWAKVYRNRRRQGFRILEVPEDRKEPGTIQIIRNPGLDKKNSPGESNLIPKRPD